MTCQIIIVALFVLGIFYQLHRDINGRKEQKPLGFSGVVVTLIVQTLLCLLYWKAGAFSTLLPSNE